MSGAYLVYVLRPNRTSLWLPAKLLEEMGIERGQQLTERQFQDERIQEILTRRNDGR